LWSYTTTPPNVLIAWWLTTFPYFYGGYSNENNSHLGLKEDIKAPMVQWIQQQLKSLLEGIHWLVQQ
jgi:hypothetical protein